MVSFASGSNIRIGMRCPRCDHESLTDESSCRACGGALSILYGSARNAAPSSYTPQHLRAEILTSKAAIEGERKQVTVLFCDIAGSTALAERHGDEAMHLLFDWMFGVALAEVHRYEGTINQFLGDGFMALFGAPVAHEDHARRAALAALAIQNAVCQRPPELAVFGSASIALRIGLNTGPVVVGSIGDNLRMDYTAIGDTTNLAARIQQLAEPGSVYVAGATRRLIDAYVESVSVGMRQIKGKTVAVPVHRLVGVKRRAATQASSASAPAPIMLGRDAELNALRDALARLRSGRGSAVMVLGDAGIGKSRLVAEMARIATDEGVQWLEGRALSFGSALSYWPFLDLLQRAAGINEDDDAGAAAAKLERRIRALFPGDFATVLPYLATLMSLPVPSELELRVKYLDAQSIGRQIFRSVRLFVERMARERPLVLAFEDLHWADSSSVELIRHLLPLVAHVPLLIVGICRLEREGSTASLRAFARTECSTHYSEIELDQLTMSESEALLDRLVADGGIASRVKQLVIERAEGNPFFLEEILHALVADGVLEWDPSQGRWRVGRSDVSVTLPDTLHGVITARIDRLESDTKQVIKVASVIGRSFLERVLAGALDDVDRLDDHLRELEALELIREKRRVPEPEYLFKHVLMQEAVYATLLSPQRRDLHRRVAECVERLFADRLEDFFGILSYHYARAEVWPKAQEFLFKAGDHAGRVAADAEALTHYQNAIAAYERVFGDKWDPFQRASLERKIGEALFRRGAHEQALAYVMRGKARLHKPLTEMPASAWGIRLAIGVEAARRLLRPVTRHLPFFRPPPIDQTVLDEIARMGEVTGWIDYFLNPERFLLEALIGLRFYEAHPHAVGLIYNHMSIGLICDVIPNFRLAEAHHRHAVAIASEAEQPVALGHAELGMGIHVHSLGQPLQARSHYQRAAGLFHETGHIRGWGGASMMLAWVCEDLGEFRPALEYANAVCAIGEQSSDPQVRAWGLLRRGASRRHLGQIEDASRDLEQARALSSGIPDYASVVQAGSLLALCHLDLGRKADARRLLDDAAVIRQQRKLRGMWVGYSFTAAAALSIAELDDAAQDRSRLLRRAAMDCRAAAKLGKMARHWQPAAFRLEGDLAWRHGRNSEARRLWQRSMIMASEVGNRYQLALSTAEIGHRYQRRTELERAVVLLNEAGATPDAARVQRWLDAC